MRWRLSSLHYFSSDFRIKLIWCKFWKINLKFSKSWYLGECCKCIRYRRTFYNKSQRFDVQNGWYLIFFTSFKIIYSSKRYVLTWSFSLTEIWKMKDRDMQEKKNIRKAAWIISINALSWRILRRTSKWKINSFI